MIGICTGLDTGQKGGNDYSINMVQMYKLLNHTHRPNTVCIYGNATTLGDSTEIAMHLASAQVSTSTEFVFFTAIALDRISVQDKGLNEWRKL